MAFAEFRSQAAVAVAQMLQQEILAAAQDRAVAQVLAAAQVLAVAPVLAVAQVQAVLLAELDTKGAPIT